eukprot:COSAG01_NODE_69681_length_260_cov_1.683230_1_plen_25_part_10
MEALHLLERKRAAAHTSSSSTMSWI